MCDLEEWTLQYWVLPPYTEVSEGRLEGVIHDFILHATQTCCGLAVTEYSPFKTRRYDNQQDMLKETVNKSIAFPMICSSMSLANAPADFVRLFQTDGLVQVTRQRNEDRNVFTNGLWTVWPLFVTIIILTGYASILIWLSDFCGRIRRFNRNVVQGLFEGYWFAFVSATTVGYGDKVPGTVLGKCLAMFWILCGICVTSAFTASITTLLSSFQQAMTEMAALDDGRVGVMKGTVDKELLLQKNAYIAEYGNLEALIEALKNHTVESIVLDHFFYAHYKANFKDSVYLRRHSVTQPTTVGIMLNIDMQPGFLECVRKQAFLRHLIIADDVAASVEHSGEMVGEKDPFEEAAQNLFGNTYASLIIMGSTLLVAVGVLWAVDWLVTRLRRPAQGGRGLRHKWAASEQSGTQDCFLSQVTDTKPQLSVYSEVTIDAERTSTYDNSHAANNSNNNHVAVINNHVQDCL